MTSAGCSAGWKQFDAAWPQEGFSLVFPTWMPLAGVIDFLEVCQPPQKNGAWMAAASHLKDPAVRRAAAEYKAALKKRAKAIKRVIDETEAAESLLARRRQERELIKLATSGPDNRSLHR
jgi:hypothetical protein